MVQTHSPRPFISLVLLDRMDRQSNPSQFGDGCKCLKQHSLTEGRSPSSNSFSNFFAEQFASHRIDSRESH